MQSKLLVSYGETRAGTRPRLGQPKTEPAGMDAVFKSSDTGDKVLGNDG